MIDCLTLRKKGQSYRDIAASIQQIHGVTITHVTAFNHVQRALTQLTQQRFSDAEELREMELERLNWMLESISASVDAGDPASINTALRIEESRRKLLGLDAPTKVSPTTPDGKDEYVGLGDTERTAKLMAIIDAARARACAQAD